MCRIIRPVRNVRRLHLEPGSFDHDNEENTSASAATHALHVIRRSLCNIQHCYIRSHY